MKRDEAIRLIQEGIFNLKGIPKHLRSDETILYEATVGKPFMRFFLRFDVLNNLKYLKERDEVIEKITNKYAFNFFELPDHFKNDKKVVLAAVGVSGVVFKNLSDELRGDKDVALVAIKRNVDMFQYVSDELKGDKEVVMVAVEGGCKALKFASVKLRDDKEVVLAAIKQENKTHKLCREDPIMKAVNTSSTPIDFLVGKLTGLNVEGKKALASASGNHGGILRLVSDRLKNDKEVVLEAIKENGCAIKCVGDDLKNDKEVALEAIRQNGYAYMYCSEQMQRDGDVIALTNRSLKKMGSSVDDLLCGKLKELKKKYGLHSLEMVLEVEAAEIEANQLRFNDNNRSVESAINGKLHRRF